MSVFSKVLILLGVFTLGVVIYFYGHKFQDSYVNMYTDNKKKPIFWEYSSSKEHTNKEIKRAGFALMIISVFLLALFILDYFTT
jgi:hypothetical protein